MRPAAPAAARAPAAAVVAGRHRPLGNQRHGGPGRPFWRPAARCGPTPASGGVSFPFPQNRSLAGCSTPSGYLDADVMAAYQQWKTDTVVSDGKGNLRVQRLASDTQSDLTPLNSTVSEGIGYGMIIAVFMGDKPTFDGLWAYERQHLDEIGLMNWAVSASGESHRAGRRHRRGRGHGVRAADGGQAVGRIRVRSLLTQDPGRLEPRDLGQQVAAQRRRLGRLEQPQHLVLRARLLPPVQDGGHRRVAQMGRRREDQLRHHHRRPSSHRTATRRNGLVPAWSPRGSGDGGVAGAGPAAQPFNYQYDSCRTPFRIGARLVLVRRDARRATTWP